MCGKTHKILTGHVKSVQSLAILSNNELASGSGDETIKIWNIRKGFLIRTIDVYSSVYSLQTLKKKWLASGCGDNKIKILIKILVKTRNQTNKINFLNKQ